VVDLSAFSAADAAAVLRADGVHALVDLDAHIEVSGRKPLAVLAHGAAPAVCQWLGWAGTSGHPAVGYAALDRAIAPADSARAHFSERLSLLPHAYQANNHAFKWLGATAREASGPAARARALARLVSAADGDIDDDDAAGGGGGGGGARGARGASAVACSFNQLFKLSGDVYASWKGVLRRAAPALMVQGAGVTKGRKTSLSRGTQNLHDDALADGVNAHTQLFFARPLPKGPHLERMAGMCDLALDTLLYNSHTTGADALWSATPLVTLRGPAMASRVAHSLSAAAGVADTTVFSHREYADLATALLTPRRSVTGKY
jgi:predicted O-linked N-acetylglucosamine transferase (SPINDLY family)